MNTVANAAQAYQSSIDRRGLREQEADLFRRVLGGLRRASDSDDMLVRARALADNRRLWSALTDVMRDPENKLPVKLRASIVSIGMAVHRDMDAPNPDFGFLISVNENLAAGLSH